MMIITKPIKCCFLASLCIFALGFSSSRPESNRRMASFPESAQVSGPVRPDIDENDRWRDQRFDMEGVLDELDIQSGMKIAEVGAGEGYLTFKLAKRVSPGGFILAEDIDPKSLEILSLRASERGLENIETILGTEYDPRLPPGQLDMIFMHAVIQFIADRPRLIRAAGAALKENGRFVIIEPETDGPEADDKLTGPGPFPTRKGYLEIFRRAGLVLVSAEKKKDRISARIGSSEKTVFVLRSAPKLR